ncbi:MAG: hypothetical protein QXU40_00390 [Candidatus Pacearchaeota archaeon]
MFNSILFLETGTFYSNGVGAILSTWEQVGVFSYLIPFLLIFSLVFGILTKIKVFDNRAVNGIISFSVGLLALQFNFVPLFFSKIFPKVGVGLAIILALIILVGLFFDPNNKFTNYLLLIIGFVILAIVLLDTYSSLTENRPSFLDYLQYNWPTIVGVILFFVLIAIIIGIKTPETTLSEQRPYIFFPHNK